MFTGPAALDMQSESPFGVMGGCFCYRSSIVAVVCTGLNTSGNCESSHCSRCETLAKPLCELRKPKEVPDLALAT